MDNLFEKRTLGLLALLTEMILVEVTGLRVKWGQAELGEAIWAWLGQGEVIWAQAELGEAIWAWLGQGEVIWAQAELWEVIWPWLGLGEEIWGPVPPKALDETYQKWLP